MSHPSRIPIIIENSIIKIKIFTFQNSFGGGFGPACDDGYGTSYTIPNDSTMFFYTSAKKNYKHSSAERFMDNIFSSMADLKQMYEQAWGNGSEKMNNGGNQNGGNQNGGIQNGGNQNGAMQDGGKPVHAVS